VAVAADLVAVAAGASAADRAAAAALRGDGDMYFTYAAVIVCGIVLLWYVLTFNALVKARNAVDQAWSHIEVELQRRFDLIQNLVEVAKGYAKYESDTFKQVTALRTQERPFGDAAAANHAQPELNRAIVQIMALAESYPELRADQSFLSLQQELSETENRIAERRHAYNQTVNVYQNLLHSIPSNVVADVQGLQEREFFDAPDAEVEQVPVVKLS
jgi:LemA protein